MRHWLWTGITAACLILSSEAAAWAGIIPVKKVPEPNSLILFGSAVAGLLVLRRIIIRR
jgi:hypothetical protein